jgi:hypothetical protein
VTGCAQIPGIAPEFNAGQNTLTSYAAGQPMAIDPGTAEADQGAVGSVARPAVMVEERTVPVSTPKAGAPQNLAPPMRAASAEPEPLPPASRGTPNLAAPAEQPKSKLLTPDEKAKVIAELEALAKSQSAQLRKSSKSDCANETVPPGKRVASAGGEC